MFLRPALAWKALAVLFLAAGMTPSQPLSQALFELKEMDLHLHAGMEREIEMKDWIDLAVSDGRKVILLLDHLELYRKSPQEYEAWRAKGNFQARYPLGVSGHQALMADFDEAAKRRDVIVFKGWEVYEGELDTGLEAAPLRMADVIGFHVSPNHGREAPNGRTLIKRVKQIKDAQKQFPVPMILFHPFPMRLENLQRTAADKGRDLKTLTVEEYRFFQPGEQEELARLLKNTSIYIEISRATERYFADPVCREALIADIKPLAEAGVQFTISTDNHNVGSAKKPFTPSLYADALGVTPLNSNAVVRELLALRARRSLASQ
jgi:histidinol phosphatase-like PHP family hydrolase